MRLRRHYIPDGHGGQIHLTEAGSGPCVLLVHQTPRSADEFREVMEALAGRMRLVAIDLPGMGNSTPVQAEATIEDYADAVCRVADWMDSPSICLCGHHTGGVVALEVASRQPNWLSSLILSSTPWIDAQERNARHGKAPIDTAEHVAEGSHLLDYWSQRSPYYPQAHEYLDRLLADVLRADAPSTGHMAVGKYRMEARADRVKCPVLLVEHRLDPFSVRHTQSLIENLKPAAFRSIDQGCVALEVTAQKFAGILTDWIEARRDDVSTVQQHSEPSHEPRI